LEVQFHEHDAGDPGGFKLRHIFFPQVFPHVDLYHHADVAVVGGHPDSFHQSHINPAELDGGIELEALHRFVEIADVGRALLKVAGGAHPDDGDDAHNHAQDHKEPDDQIGFLPGHITLLGARAQRAAGG
jgi:hypothetical protein